MNKPFKITFATLLLVLVLAPVLILVNFIHPATDDYGFYLLLKNDNVFNAVIGIMKGMDSRLSGDFYSLMFCPVESLLRYRMTIACFIVLFFVSVYLLFIALNKFYLKTSGKNIYFFFAIFCFLFIGYMPGLSEAFYWYSGIAIWMFGVCLFNFFVFLILHYPGLKTKFLRISVLILICFLGFSFTTHNEILLFFMGLLFLICIWNVLKNKNSRFKVEYAVFCTSLALGFFIVLLLKGNYERMKFISSEQYASFTKVIVYNALLYRKLFFLTDVVLFNIILFPFYYSVSASTKQVISPRNLILVSSFLLIVMILPSVIAKTLYSFRIQDVVYYFFILIVCFNFFNFAVSIRRREVLVLENALKYSYVLLVFFVLNYASQRVESQKVLRVAYTDLLGGSAKEYDGSMKNRYIKIRESSSDTIVLEPLKAKPQSVFYDDITTDPYDWRNMLYCEYFKKKSIRLSQD
jgi:hypothetical protein